MRGASSVTRSFCQLWTPIATRPAGSIARLNWPLGKSSAACSSVHVADERAKWPIYEGALRGPLTGKTASVTWISSDQNWPLGEFRPVEERVQKPRFAGKVGRGATDRNCQVANSGPPRVGSGEVDRARSRSNGTVRRRPWRFAMAPNWEWSQETVEAIGTRRRVSCYPVVALGD